MSQLSYPQVVLRAFVNLKDQLTSYLSVNNPDICESLNLLIEQIADTNTQVEQRKVATDLLKLVSSHDDIRDQVKSEIQKITIQEILISQIENDLRAFASHSGKKLPDNTFEVLAEPISYESGMEERYISMASYGIDGGKSIKLSNFRLDFDKMSELFAGIMLAGHEAIEKPHPLIIAAGILFIIRALKESFTIEISQNEASVYWGFTRVQDENLSASEEEIEKQTNKERSSIGLKPLKKNEIRHALQRLSMIDSVQIIDSEKQIWRTREKPWIV
jgi:hypothetical protein